MGREGVVKGGEFLEGDVGLIFVKGKGRKDWVGRVFYCMLV